MLDTSTLTSLAGYYVRPHIMMELTVPLRTLKAWQVRFSCDFAILRVQLPCKVKVTAHCQENSPANHLLTVPWIYTVLECYESVYNILIQLLLCPQRTRAIIPLISTGIFCAFVEGPEAVFLKRVSNISSITDKHLLEPLLIFTAWPSEDKAERNECLIVLLVNTPDKGIICYPQDIPTVFIL